jgi:hypothetical protein
MASTLKARTRSFGVLSRRMGTAFVEQPGDSGEAERCSGIGLKLFGFIPEPVFTFIPESCSGSSRNAVRNHPGIAFILLRIPQQPS